MCYRTYHVIGCNKAISVNCVQYSMYNENRFKFYAFEKVFFFYFCIRIFDHHTLILVWAYGIS